jgi:predicted transcriptional regulator
MSSLPHAGIDLTPTQQRILQELVTRYREREAPVKGEAVAEGVDRNAGTIRNQMQSLKALQLVEGIPGPQGGYKPTSTAYEALSIQDVGEPAEVPLYHDGERVEGATVGEINLTSVLHPEDCRAEIQLQGLLGAFHEGDAVVVGPTPLSELRIDGVIEGIDDVNNTLVVVVESMQAPADPP